MKAVQFDEHGDRDVLRYAEYPAPEVGRDDCLVDVKAAALNHLDVFTREGVPGVDLEFPHVPGSDAAGVVTETGADVTRFGVGDRVAVLAGRTAGDDEFSRHGDPTLAPDYHLLGEHVRGVHAEELAVPEANLVRVPEGVDWEVAASAPLVFGTAWRMLVSRAELRPGDAVLVLGASGGVGHAAVQVAAHAGAEVYATASTPAKLEHARDCGADRVLDYTEEPFHRWVKGETDGRGVDVVVDHVGEATWERSLKSLAKGGTLVTCGATTGALAETNVNRVFWRQLRIVGSTMATPGEFDDALELVWDGTFEPRVRAVLPMSEISEAHRLLEDREGFGKVVVIPDSEYE
jgi:NADPH2:quinone reductase